MEDKKENKEDENEKTKEGREKKKGVIEKNDFIYPRLG